MFTIAASLPACGLVILQLILLFFVMCVVTNALQSLLADADVVVCMYIYTCLAQTSEIAALPEFPDAFLPVLGG